MIPVYVRNGKAHLWDANDVCCLREEHRIAGTLVGCLSRLPRQNVQLGLPLQLMPEEVTLLKQKGLIELLDDSQPAEAATTQEVQEFQERRKQLYQEQIDLCREDAEKQRLLRLPDIIEGQKKKRRKLLEERESAGETVDESELDKEIEFDVERIKIPPLPEKSSCVQISTACHRSKVYPAASWDFPKTEEERTRWRVFQDLWEKGHWLSSGGKFGGDFLVYPGEPARFHSYYIAICVPYRKPLSVQDIMTFSRLGANVKKTVVLCSVDSKDELKYTSLQWTGIK